MNMWRVKVCIILLLTVLVLVVVNGDGKDKKEAVKPKNHDRVEDPLVNMICKVIMLRRFVGLCESDLDVVKAFGPVVSFQEEYWNPDVDLYPHSFFARPRLPKDPIASSKKTDGECGNDPNNIPISLLRVPLAVDPSAKKKNKKKSARISTLSMLLQIDDETKHPYDYEETISHDLYVFEYCIDQSFPKTYNYHDSSMELSSKEELLLAWMKSKEAKECKKIANREFNIISDLLSEADNNRDEINTILRSLANIWGRKPSLLAILLLLSGGCDSTEDSYDEFISCRLVLGDLKDVILEINVHKRNVDPEHFEDQWKCQTCGLHQHPRWFASRAVVGSVTYTVARPDCKVEGEKLPTFEELDRKLGFLGSTDVDKKGSRYHMGHENVVWETSEVVTLSAHHSLLFPPSWYHRIIPPGPHSNHTAVTLVAKYRMDPIVATSNSRRVPKHTSYMVLKPNEIVANTSTKESCYHIMDVIMALLDPHIDIKRGIVLPTCNKDQLYSMKRVGVFNEHHRIGTQQDQLTEEL